MTISCAEIEQAVEKVLAKRRWSIILQIGGISAAQVLAVVILFGVYQERVDTNRAEISTLRQISSQNQVSIATLIAKLDAFLRVIDRQQRTELDRESETALQ